MAMTLQAMQFAIEKHTGQVRKYTGEPYWTHLAEVAGIVSTTPLCTTDLLQIAWLHDTIEDTETTFDELVDTFGYEIATGVQWLTDVEVGNRKTRKILANKRLAAAPPRIQTIKYADGLSNLKSILTHDKKFAKVYVKEWEDLLAVMNNGDHCLYAMICREVRQAKAVLEIQSED